MQVKINPVFSYAGKRRSKKEIRDERPLLGELTIEAVREALPGNPKTVAKLRSPDRRNLEPYCGWLYDPEICTMDSKGFYLRGFAVVEERSEIFIHMQVWWVRLAEPFEFNFDSRH